MISVYRGHQQDMLTAHASFCHIASFQQGTSAPQKFQKRSATVLSKRFAGTRAIDIASSPEYTPILSAIRAMRYENRATPILASRRHARRRFDSDVIVPLLPPATATTGDVLRRRSPPGGKDCSSAPPAVGRRFPEFKRIIFDAVLFRRPRWRYAFAGHIASRPRVGLPSDGLV